MARIVKGTKRYLLFRGKDEHGRDILIDMFTKKELDAALNEGRIESQDHIVKVGVLGKVDLKKPNQSKKG